MLRILKLIKGNIFLMIIVIISLLISIYFEVQIPYISKVIIDDYILSKTSFSSLIKIVLVFALFNVLFILFTYLYKTILTLISEKIIHNLRMKLFDHIVKLPLSYFDKNSSGQITTRLTNDVEALSDFFPSKILDLVKDLFIIIATLIMMIKMHLQLTLVCSIAIPIIFLITYPYKNKSIKNYSALRNILGNIKSNITETLYGMKIIQIFNIQNQKYKEFKEINDSYNKLNFMEVVLTSVFRPLFEIIQNLIIALIIFYAIGNDTIKIGVIYAFINYSKKFFNPIMYVADNFSELMKGLVASSRIFEIFDNYKVEQENSDEGIMLSNSPQIIEFKNVWFAYDNENYVLKDVSFKIEKNKLTAFVGTTGSGKTTIASLIFRFYKIQKGQILIDGINLYEINLQSLRERITYIIQNIFMFNGDINYNISLDENADQSRIVKTAKISNLHEFILNKSNQYEEYVNEGGTTLSYGERQLISLARGLYKESQVLILDESTSNIDTITESLIQDSIEKIRNDKTLIVIAHRLSTIKHADKIIVLDNGTIIEEGNHFELLEKEGFYFKLYSNQILK